ncbi:universal stress protein [Microbacterium immunditiarum]|uniref:Nucleotide-binding universal stress UspA family protein n=1 Tax=Microbacterium immunditiarum TaxID=337480 RepID=A0A7Y9GRI2_9MICO|nr:universal stress protein [Microbacterium immunditiarum]NYE21298.1 nucleotide-binding universal stress UspA family protein [Microbacterium immunditiarum]
MSSTIIVGVTAAPAARRAVDWAVARAAERGQTVELVGVVGGAIGAVGEESVLNDAVDQTRSLLSEEAARVAERGVQVTTRVGRGNPVAWLIEASADADLLVIGSDYKGPGSGPARGAHGLRIAAAAKCPVVVVPDLDFEGRSGVLVGVDGSEISEAAVRFAAAEADRLREPLLAVTVWTPLEAPRNLGWYPEEYLENMRLLAEESLALSLAGTRQDYPDLEIVTRVERGYPSLIINELAASARLAVIGTHGRGALARFLLGSISQEVLARLATVTAVVR